MSNEIVLNNVYVMDGLVGVNTIKGSIASGIAFTASKDGHFSTMQSIVEKGWKVIKDIGNQPNPWYREIHVEKEITPEQLKMFLTTEEIVNTERPGVNYLNDSIKELTEKIKSLKAEKRKVLSLTRRNVKNNVDLHSGLDIDVLDIDITLSS